LSATGRPEAVGGTDRIVVSAALCRAVLLGRAAVTVIAAGAGLPFVAHPGRVATGLALVVVSTTLEVAALTRWPGVVARTAAVLVLDTALLGAVLALDAESAAFPLFAAGAAALAGVLLGVRAWPLWALQATICVVPAARAVRPAPGASALVVAFPLVTVVAGLVAVAVTSATVRHLNLLVEGIAGARRGSADELRDSLMEMLRAVSFAAIALPASLRKRPVLADQLADVIVAGVHPPAREFPDGLYAENPAEPFHLTVERMCRDWSQISRTPVRVIADPVELALSTRYALSRILHEALTNVAQHSDARRVDVGLRRAGDGVRLVVRDDGGGFSVPPDLELLRSGGHFGVLAMAERADAIGGEFIVRSAPSDGTLIEVLVPVAPPPVPGADDRAARGSATAAARNQSGRSRWERAVRVMRRSRPGAP